MHLTEREQTVLEFIKEFYKQHGHSPSIREICKGLGLKSPGSMYKVLKSLRKKGLLDMDEGRRRTIRLKVPPNLRHIPLIGKIAAGPPIEANQEIIEELPCDPGLFGASECFALLVKGDSMIGQHIRPGDIAIIKPGPVVEQGTIAAVMVEGLFHEATLKRVKWDENSIKLLSENPAYPPLVFEGEERSKVTILGMLVGIIRRFS
ncbi:SOS-response repressor and protease LexA [Dissulfuribacter thermophilus]|uniref:LexA repressor n=1 Tax=Dissulfuribacter thermophilus TaxID=1156395 RepID=A0A1B9F7U1_9BACT|nr:transcriptional repressor LexA [Dissulfuribacter thermophilus]OCC16009.1 SOS-response repressor and protease LexA [Dissulfuribacter thermophilus]